MCQKYGFTVGTLCTDYQTVKIQYKSEITKKINKSAKISQKMRMLTYVTESFQGKSSTQGL